MLIQHGLNVEQKIEKKKIIPKSTIHLVYAPPHECMKFKGKIEWEN